MRRGVVVALLSVVLLVAGCASLDTGAVHPDTSTPPSVQTPTTGADDSPRDDLHDEHVVPWTRFEVIGSNTIRVFFPAGADTCYGTRAVVRETPTAIQVATIEGVIPDAPEVCPALGREASLIVDALAPIGDRDVVPLATPDLK